MFINFVCKICGRNFKRSDSLGHHIRKGHNQTTNQYYDKFLLKIIDK